MTTIPQVLLRVGDRLVLKVDRRQICTVAKDQQLGETHIKVWRANQPCAELIQRKDLTAQRRKA